MVTGAEFRITGPATEGHSVPADVLVRSIQSLQQSVLLLAAEAESQTVRRRFKPNQDLRKKFTLRLATAVPGSYAVPLSLLDERPQKSLESETSDLLSKLAQVWRAISEDNLPAARGLVTDEGFLVRLLQELRRALPRHGDRWSIALGVTGLADVELGTRHRPVVEKWLERPTVQQETAVIGELLSINFAEKKLSIRYEPTQQEIECSYLEEIEDTIVDARRGFFQVVGQFVLDRDGNPKRLTDVSSVEPIDLGPAEFPEIDFENYRLVINPPILVVPELEPETKQYFVATIEELGFSLYGRTRDALLQDFEEQLRFAWREYGLAGDEELTEDARELKNRLVARLRRAESA
jgi:hypothetical protein